MEAWQRVSLSIKNASSEPQDAKSACAKMPIPEGLLGPPLIAQAG